MQSYFTTSLNFGVGKTCRHHRCPLLLDPELLLFTVDLIGAEPLWLTFVLLSVFFFNKLFRPEYERTTRQYWAFYCGSDC